MMPGIIISLIFIEHGRLTFRAVPLENQLAGPKESLDDTANWLSIQIGTANFPRSTRSGLLALEQPRFYQSLNRMVTHAREPSGFAQADSLRVGRRAFLTWNRMIAPRCGDTDLVPPLLLSS